MNRKYENIASNLQSITKFPSLTLLFIYATTIYFSAENLLQLIFFDLF